QAAPPPGDGRPARRGGRGPGPREHRRLPGPTAVRPGSDGVRPAQERRPVPAAGPMIYLELAEVLELHRRLIEQSGGLQGVRDPGQVEAALAQPQMTFGGQELYPTLADKAAALGFALIRNHPFVDGNKRVGQAAMELF